MEELKTGEWRQLLTILLAQRLELNAVENALKTANILTGPQIREMRIQASNAAKAWSAPGDDLLALLRVHSSPDARMSIPPM